MRHISIYGDEAGDFSVFMDADVRPAGVEVEAEDLTEIPLEVGALAFLDVVGVEEGWCSVSCLRVGDC